MRTRLGTLGLALAFAFGLGGAQDAWAKPKKKKPPVVTKTVTKKPDPKVAPPSADQKKALAELMGAFTFKMNKDDVIAALSKQIDERYAEQISGTSDVYAQDKLRKEKNKEVTRIKQSFTEFDGKKTGWDVSLIDEEFAHKTGESMLVYWENANGKNQRRFFFFEDGKLWKMFIAIDTKALQEEQRNFDFFRGLMEARYGKGKVADGRETWDTSDFQVQAVDKMAFYGAFGLVIQDPSELRAIAEIRAANAPEKKDKDSIIEVIKSKDGDGPGLNDNSDAVDDIIKGSK